MQLEQKMITSSADAHVAMLQVVLYNAMSIVVKVTLQL